jgi:hypothetical protein
VSLVTTPVYVPHTHAIQALPQGVPTAITAFLVEIATYSFFEVAGAEHCLILIRDCERYLTCKTVLHFCEAKA